MTQRDDRGMLLHYPWPQKGGARSDHREGIGLSFGTRRWKNTLPWHPGPAAKVRILHFKNLPPFRHDPGLQVPRLRYSPGLAPTTRLNALLNAASDT
jgi:hypothetical protein